jgi:hypothetical protein
LRYFQDNFGFGEGKWRNEYSWKNIKAHIRGCEIYYLYYTTTYRVSLL